jgi:hypothetical protein
MKPILLTLLLASLLFSAALSQSITQTIRGTVVELDTEIPVAGASVVLVNSDPLTGTVSDTRGEFRLEHVPVGRHTLQISFIGFKTVTLPALDLVSGKELILKVVLEENIIETGEVVIRPNTRKDKPLNDLAVVSARSFTVEETERYAGSWGDPARMTQNFAGVMVGNDQLNAIIVRGNSPSGLLWMLDGLPIPNPNHFGSMGSTSGPISMLNNNTLSNSDFFSGAFPAQYGNASSSVFDLNMRTGNNEKREYMGQIGFNGFELGAEGPFSKKSNASYIANYRYSTLGVFNALGIDMGIGAVPYYQDLSFKLDFPGTRLGRISVFGLGARDHITFDDPADEYGKKEYTDFACDIGALGLNHILRIHENSRLKTTVGITYQKNATISKVYRDEVLNDWYGDDLHESKIYLAEEFRGRMNAKNTLLVGANMEAISMGFLDSVYLEEPRLFVRHLDFDGSLILFSGYAQLQHKFTNRLSLIPGIHIQKTSINKEIAIEPRVSLEWQLAPDQTFSLGYGLHSQMQARDVYFREVLVDTLNGTYIQTNKSLDFSRSHHLVLGYNLMMNEKLRLKTEAYFQYLYHIPVKQYPSSIAVINKDAGYFNMNLDSLVNEGTGRNIGLEITFERFLTNNYYYLATLSIFDSRYTASDKILRNTAYNGNYVFNILGGYEFRLPHHNILALDAKFTWAGGLRSIPIDLEASRQEGSTVFDYSRAFEDRNPHYYRADLRISFKMNRPKYSQEWALDITNVTNHKNWFFEMYNPDTDQVEEIGQMGIVPVVLWRIRF